MSFIDLFQRQVSLSPKSLAVSYGDAHLSYEELDRQSTSLASRLLEKGVTIGDVIALGVFNGLDLMVCFLAILKCGGIYLPLDPNYPKERRDLTLSHSQAKLLIVDANSAPLFSMFEGKSLTISQEDYALDCVKLPQISLQDPAYIIYTSGSTGVPKGILVSHEALQHATLAFKEVNATPMRAMLGGSVSFDPSLLIMIHMLTTGGVVSLYNNQGYIDIEDFAPIVQLIDDESIEFLITTPSFYKGILQQCDNLSSLSKVFLCGEYISKSLLEKHKSVAQKSSLYNAYGPSEYAIGSTLAKIYCGQEQRVYPITIGQPFYRNKVYILDEALKRVTGQNRGEIYVGGDGLAMGYLYDDALTQEKFIDSVVDQESIRLYQTGDMGYIEPGGDMVFTGRKDFQVKVNGHRIELEEIEHHLLDFPLITKTAVIVHKDQLIAFFCSDGREIEVEELIEYLQSLFPPYMIPSSFVAVDHWPLTKNGKTDRKALEKKLV